ncbi:MGH1-like glycoside hydrolase domain-containing protein [Micromonospora sp. DT47]|uniref:MGH1-like glycoside hydrolase domain-containing protein n=1 Tax=Micromonospora sp. DT47 TaxID=3393431 RepID=UPI003CE85924
MEEGASIDDLRAEARQLLERHWDEERGYCVPNPTVYPHLWLWDSCFHAITWARLGDVRAAREFDAVLLGQLPGGLVPHMRYGGAPPDAWLGPLPATSSLAQPPMFGHAAKVLIEEGLHPSPEALARARRGVNWLWDNRRTDLDLIYVVHPWEAGNDHSPRWDDWGAPGRTAQDYDRGLRSAWNKQRMDEVSYHPDGAAAWSSSFVACPAGFNAYVAFNMAELAEVLDDPVLAERAGRVSTAMDTHLWDPTQRLWRDLAVVGGGPSVTVPISDGVMGALVTADRSRAIPALQQLIDPDRFEAIWGPTNVARTHPAYDPQMYWRGAAWPHLNYLLWLALNRWDLADEAGQLAARSQDAARASGWAEYWNPETGQGLGAIPQSWTTLVATMTARGMTEA